MMRLCVLAFVVVVVCGTALGMVDDPRPVPPAFCQDPPKLHFCAVLPGQGAPLPPPVPADTQFSLYVLQAPIWEFVPGVGTITKALKLIHTAIGVVNEETGEGSVFEAEGIFESPNATFPWIVPNENVPGGKELVWCNAGAVCYDSQIDWSYYTETISKVATINGTIFNKLFAWLPVNNATLAESNYETFRVQRSWPDGELLFPSHTCDDYAWEVLGVLKGWGVEYNSNATDLYRVFLNFYVGDNDPIKANMSDPDTFQKVVDSYAKYDLNAKIVHCAGIADKTEKYVCAAELIDDLFNWLEEDKYFYDPHGNTGDYYYLDQTSEDGLSFDWKYAIAPIVAQSVDDAHLATIVDPQYAEFFLE